jgi:hypothetical protein
VDLEPGFGKVLHMCDQNYLVANSCRDNYYCEKSWLFEHETVFLCLLLGDQIILFIKLASLYQAIPEDIVKSLLAACKSGEFDVANKEVSNIIADGYPVSQLLSQVSYVYVVHRCHNLVTCCFHLTTP